MNSSEKMNFLSWLLLKQNPKMLVRPCLNKKCFKMIPFKTLDRVSYDRDAFVNKSKKMYKMIFGSYDELLDAMFDADEIWYGSERYKNALYNAKDQMLIKYDLEKNV